jgi:hypothetical protein
MHFVASAIIRTMQVAHEAIEADQAATADLLAHSRKSSTRMETLQKRT